MVNFDQHKAPVGIETHFHLLRRPQVVFLFWITFRVQKGSVVRNQLALGLGLTVVFLVFAASSTEWSHLGDVQETFRWNVLKDSLRMFAHKPILGWGLGTFDVVYPAYRSFYTTLYVNAAHNDYLQVLIETGIVGFSCVVWFGSVLYRTGLKGLGHWNQSWRGALQLSRSWPSGYPPGAPLV